MWRSVVIVVFCLFSCSARRQEKHTLLKLLDADVTGVKFSNDLSYTEEFNPYTYRNFYNGAGVAIGDINNDGLDDIYFAGNQVDNKLYLNHGQFRFTDITESAKVACPKVWCTGVVMADVNEDGWLDIYVCKSGAPGTGVRHNELFINNHDLTFTERSKEYGLDLMGLSTHAAFFDYDNDEDLDAYIISNSLKSIGGFDLKKDQRLIYDESGQATKLLRNDGGKFVDVTKEAGIYSSNIGFGLGVTVGDVNQDGWLDIFVSNDFFERDYLYINSRNGKFAELGEQYFNSLSLGSMGADLADLNNDNWPDLVVTEMLPDRPDRYRTKANFENWDKQKITSQAGYHHQYPRNMLHMNSGRGWFSEVGRLAGIEATDWSWGALASDIDGDGLKDIFVANGIRKDLVDQDYANFMADPATVRSILSRKGKVIEEIINKIPSEQLPNYVFKNLGGMHFDNVSTQWGVGDVSWSNGAAVADLDNDNDPDLVVSNIDGQAFIYENTARERKANFTSIQLKGPKKNQFAVGAKVMIHTGRQMQYQEVIPTRGFMSSSTYKLTFGLGSTSKVDSIIVSWPDGRYSIQREVEPNIAVSFDYENSKQLDRPLIISPARSPFTVKEFEGFKDEENDFSDFDRDRLLFQMVSNEGPKMCKGDVNRDGREDFYIGGSKDEAGKLFQQERDGTFRSTNHSLFESDKVSEDCGCEFFDADKDGDLDLYVTTGSNELPTSSTALIDLLYFNDGRGNFSKSEQLLPTSNFESTSVVRACDFDDDGDLDLFVGVRMQPFQYGVPGNGYLLENNGRGKFFNISDRSAPALKNIGMITDATWADLDKDGDQDLLVIGDWMSINAFVNNNGVFENASAKLGLNSTSGWWNRIISTDLDRDGDIDFVVGNHGLNSRFKASVEKPVRMFVNDFDQNGSIEHIVCRWWGDQELPMVLRHDLVSQMPALKKKYLRYENFKSQTINDIFSPEQLKASLVLDAKLLASVVLINKGANFDIVNLPDEAQMGPVYAIVADDFNKDGLTDIMVGGNQYRVKPEVGRYDALRPTIVYGRYADRQFFRSDVSVIDINGEVRDFLKIKVKNTNEIFVSVNSDSIKILR